MNLLNILHQSTISFPDGFGNNISFLLNGAIKQHTTERYYRSIRSRTNHIDVSTDRSTMDTPHRCAYIERHTKSMQADVTNRTTVSRGLRLSVLGAYSQLFKCRCFLLTQHKCYLLVDSFN